MKLKTLIVPALLMLTACSELQYYSTRVAPVTSKGYGADYWLAELHETRTMTPEQHQVTLGLWEQEFNSDPDTSNRIRLALLLTTSDESVRDLEQARELLEGIDPEPDAASDRELITLIRQFIDKELHARATITDARATITDLREQARQQNKQIEELEQQQQALTNIEQNIQQRDSQPEVPDNGDQ